MGFEIAKSLSAAHFGNSSLRALLRGGFVSGRLLNFQVKITDSANETFGTWREGRHDDLVLAIACAAWAAEHAPHAEVKVWFGPEDCLKR